MITDVLGSQIQSDGFVFTLEPTFIAVEDLDGDLVAYLPVLNENGYRIIRTQEDFEVEVAFWLKENVL